MSIRTRRGAIAAMLLAGAMLAGVTLAATPYYVDDARPDDSGDGETWDTAKKTIQAAVNLAGDGDTVWIANGTYTITVQISVTNGVTVRSVNGAAVTTVERTSGNIRVFQLNHADAALDGFTIRNGFGANGAGVRLDAGTVRNCVIRDNAANQNNGQGGGVWMAGGTVVSNCVFMGNSAVQSSNHNGAGGGSMRPEA